MHVLFLMDIILYVLFPCSPSEWGNALFGLEEILWSKHNFTQIKIIFEILLPAPNACLFITYLSFIVIHFNVKISIIDLSFPWELGSVRGHCKVS